MIDFRPYKAVRLGNQGARLGGGGVGLGVRIIPLRYVSAAEMQTLIYSFATLVANIFFFAPMQMGT